MLPELVEDGKSGYVVRPDEHELAGRIESLLLDRQKRDSFGAYAKEAAVKKWSYAAQARKMKDFYENLLELRKR